MRPQSGRRGEAGRCLHPATGPAGKREGAGSGSGTRPSRSCEAASGPGHTAACARVDASAGMLRPSPAHPGLRGPGSAQNRRLL